MQVSVLSSGSKGNCVLIRDEVTAVLIDLGISVRRLKTELAALSMEITNLSGVFITHEHSDHIKGLKTLSKNYNIPLYSRAGTFSAMSCIRELKPEHCNPLTTSSLTVGSLNVENFTISHDAADPCGYSVRSGREKATVATDLGLVSGEVLQALEANNILVVEANHDIQMLQQGSYPYQLKRRILGPRGHLANVDTAKALCALTTPPEQIILAHLSEQNNLPSTALNTVKQGLATKQLDTLPIYIASQTHCVTLKSK